MNISVKNVSKQLKNEKVLNNVSVEFQSGHIYGITGRNGSGKSMLLKTICGFVIPDSGKVLVCGEDIYLKKTFPKNMRAMFDSSNYLKDLTGLENLSLLASIQNKISEEDIIETLKMVNLYEERDKKFGKYSLGMKQKVGIAQVIMEEPEIMIFDEPFNGLDNESAKSIRNLLKKKKQEGKIIIIATHVKDDLDELCDVIYNMDGGRIIK